MKLFYGWVIVGVGMVVSCVGMGSMMSLGVFLQPLSQDMGWSRAGIAYSRRAQLPGMGSDRSCGDRCPTGSARALVVLTGGVLLGDPADRRQPGDDVVQFQLLFGVAVGLAVGQLLCTDDRDGHPLVHGQNRSLAVALVSRAWRIGTLLIAPTVTVDHHQLRLAHRDADAWRLAWLVIVFPRPLLRAPPPALSHAGGAAAGADGRDFTLAQVLRTPQFAAIALTHFACCAAHSGPIFHMVSYAIDCGVPSMIAATVFGVAGLAALSGRIVCGLVADRVGAKRTLVVGLAIQALAVSLYVFSRGHRELLCAVGAVRHRVWRRHAALRDPGARVFRRARHGHRVRRGGDGVDARHGDRAVGRRLDVRHVR